MKKVQVLFAVLVLSAFGLQAQKADLTSQEFAKASKFADFNETKGTPAYYPLKDGAGVPIGSCGNIYSFYINGPHQVAYNKDINATIFVHRSADVGTTGSGEMAFDYSTDGGDSWTKNVWISPHLVDNSNAVGCRYPSATIYNPAGNTDPTQARIVAASSCLTTLSPNNSWGWSFEVDATIEGTPTINDWYGSHHENNDMHQFGTEVGSDGTIWSVSVDYNATAQDYIGNVYLNKGVWSDAESKIVWERGFYTWDALPFDTQGGTEDILIGDYNVSVDPNNASHLYVVIDGCYTTDPNGPVFTPHVYESTDAGVSFTALPVIDYSDAMFGTAWDTLVWAPEGEEALPTIGGADATVDANGNIHMFCELKSNHPTWGSYYSAAYNPFPDDVLRPIQHLIDIHWNGTTWEWFYITPELAESNKWGGEGDDDPPLLKHPQIGRTSDGSQLFYSWNDSPTNGDSLNTTPDWFVYSWATNGNTFADLEGNPYPNGIINLTEGTAAGGISFYTQFAPVVMEPVSNGTDKEVELPCVIPLIDYQNGTPLDPVSMVYLNDFKVPYIGVEGVTSAKASKPDVMIFPNPVADIVGISKGNKVEIYNLLGDLIYEAQADNNAIKVNMTDYSAGTYIFKVYTNNGIVTKKVIRK